MGYIFSELLGGRECGSELVSELRCWSTITDVLHDHAFLLHVCQHVSKNMHLCLWRCVEFLLITDFFF